MFSGVPLVVRLVLYRTKKLSPLPFRDRFAAAALGFRAARSRLAVPRGSVRTKMAAWSAAARRALLEKRGGRTLPQGLGGPWGEGRGWTALGGARLSDDQRSPVEGLVVEAVHRFHGMGGIGKVHKSKP